MGLGHPPLFSVPQHSTGRIAFLWQLCGVHDTPEQSSSLCSSLSGRFCGFQGLVHHVNIRVCGGVLAPMHELFCREIPTIKVT